MKKIKLTKEEQLIEDNAENYISIKGNKLKQIKKSISESNERERISLRLNQKTLKLIKVRASEEGIPYQTLISSVLHKFVNDVLVDGRQLKKLSKHL